MNIVQNKINPHIYINQILKKKNKKKNLNLDLVIRWFLSLHLSLSQTQKRNKTNLKLGFESNTKSKKIAFCNCIQNQMEIDERNQLTLFIEKIYQIP